MKRKIGLFSMLLFSSCILASRTNEDGNRERGIKKLGICYYQKKKCVGCPYTKYICFRETGIWKTYDSTGNVIAEINYTEIYRYYKEQYRKHPQKF